MKVFFFFLLRGVLGKVDKSLTKVERRVCKVRCINSSVCPQILGGNCLDGGGGGGFVLKAFANSFLHPFCMCKTFYINNNRIQRVNCFSLHFRSISRNFSRDNAKVSSPENLMHSNQIN